MTPLHVFSAIVAEMFHGTVTVNSQVLRVQRVEQGGPGDFAHMSDEELEAYVNGDRGLEH
jgi:hypothetical protein